MKLYWILEKGDILQEGDEAWVNGRWVKTKYVGKPVIRGLFRRVHKDEAEIQAEAWDSIVP